MKKAPDKPKLKETPLQDLVQVLECHQQKLEILAPSPGQTLSHKKEYPLDLDFFSKSLKRDSNFSFKYFDQFLDEHQTMETMGTNLNHSDILEAYEFNSHLQKELGYEDGEGQQSEQLEHVVEATVEKKGSKNTKKKKGKLSKKELEDEKEKELDLLRKEANLISNLNSFMEVAIQANMVSKAHSTLKYYHSMGKRLTSIPALKEIRVFNTVMKGWAAEGNLPMIEEILQTIREDNISPSVITYAALLECLGKQKEFDHIQVERIVQEMKEKNITREDLFRKCKLSDSQQLAIFSTLSRLDPEFVLPAPTFETKYDCKLLKSLNDPPLVPKTFKGLNYLGDIETLKAWSQEQFALEKIGHFKVKSVATPPSLNDHIVYMRRKLKKCEVEWKNEITKVYHHNLKYLRNKFLAQRKISLYPYLSVLEPDVYVDIVLQEIKMIGMASESFSPGTIMLQRAIGSRVMDRYITWFKTKNGVVDKVKILYDKYLEELSENEIKTETTTRDIWQELQRTHKEGSSVNLNPARWPYEILLGIGKFLYEIIVHDVKVDVNILRSNVTEKKMIPAFYKIYRHVGLQLKEEIKPHPLLSKIYREAACEDLNFEVAMIPMVSPPMPWSTTQSGGSLISSTTFMRLPWMALQQHFLFKDVHPQQLYPSFDSLNSLSYCPWIINKPILDIIIDIFMKDGDENLDIPRHPRTLPMPEKISKEMTRSQRIRALNQRVTYQRQKGEMYSLWCDLLYKLSIANHFRDRTFWFPHNMDFRGRVYPTPPHFNHLGGDLARSILLFAKGEPLGKHGLDWLKIHLVNLTGLKKRSSIQDRLDYANKIMDNILDSADKPLTGHKWWMNSDEPWQTLACCKEIATVMRSPDPDSYVCHYPVHQDGSCNGLQHYAALGRDEIGAQQVNLAPGDLPSDVYTGVANLVERDRAFDAKQGLLIAKSLDGFVKRKVVKQTVMTIVYGVTRFGARLQILKQIKDLKDFPQGQAWAASTYLVGKTFQSIQEMFTATKLIQDWLTESASLISKVRRKPTEWITPLGLPVIQPYHRMSSHRGMAHSGERYQATFTSHYDMFARPNVMKQKNAFPPNFIHSLDSCHMMLTSIFCQRAGIQFVSVHDCFWTHPNTVDIMNKICREQFVALHNEPILEDLSQYLFNKFGSRDCVSENTNSAKAVLEKRMNQILLEVPPKGDFQLENVLKSTYFFS